MLGNGIADGWMDGKILVMEVCKTIERLNGYGWLGLVIECQCSGRDRGQWNLGIVASIVSFPDGMCLWNGFSIWTGNRKIEEK